MTGEELTAKVVASKRRVWQGVLRKLPWISLFIIGSLVFVAIFAPWLTPYDPISPFLDKRLQPPGGEHILGTDTLGRDFLTRLFFGGRITLIVAATAIVVGGGVGLFLGLVAGYVGGKVDAVISRVVDAFLAFPPILFGLLFAVTMSPGVRTVIIAISLVIWAPFARVIRGDVLSLKERDFVAQSKVDGCSSLRIIVIDILPNVLSTFMILVTLNVGMVILMEASLSFLGVGIPPPTPSWGAMVASGRQYIVSAWWICVIPGAAIMLVVLAFNLLGDWLRDFLDPKLRAQL